jgi:hypothetical protein
MNGSHKDGLYGALEEALKNSDEALDCATLFDMPEVKKHASTVNRVSDYLGNMWRKGDVARVPAPRLEGTRARWLYAWKGRVLAKPTLDEIRNTAEFTSGKVNKILSRPSLEITEEGRSVVITTAILTITIKQR